MGSPTSQLPFGWVCFSNRSYGSQMHTILADHVSIAFRLGLFL